jgi:hypothetical protein
VSLVDLVRLGQRLVAMLVLDIDWMAWVVKMDMRCVRFFFLLLYSLHDLILGVVDTSDRGEPRFDISLPFPMLACFFL